MFQSPDEEPKARLIVLKNQSDRRAPGMCKICLKNFSVYCRLLSSQSCLQTRRVNRIERIIAQTRFGQEGNFGYSIDTKINLRGLLAERKPFLPHVSNFQSI